ncbi:D-alanyl-D-alanine carboxypeptidase family protein [Ferdinandcohnia quinoae]|uniref:D-alanyl-D-alanine carboxypeptidase n=1 Tax=Fredinandcohnia quinoae TaxID=2918902 RepID=A0AAW5E473_9BACI|nr:D-alanyl-D-alanine carboxypeptidase family protein [Fredinandcohnia sp. SECRCQ15]MCH1625594.1 D-alanyl-D-alanine carboxypeptidase [Fredinandcohnia sp. SECRCQ15]
MKFVMNIFVVVIVLLASLTPIKSYAEEIGTEPSVHSEAAIVFEASTGSILFEKNSNAKMYPASLTKIATAIYAIEKGNLDDIVTVSKKAREVDGTRVYLEEGEQVPLKKLIQGLLINSGNDAGVAIAEHLEGSVEDFSDKLNQYLEEVIGVENTHFENPHGLFSENHFSTAHDLALITQYALKNSVFTEIFGTKELEWNGVSWKTTLYNHHLLLREIPYEGIIGGKNGYVEQSRHTLSTAAERGALTLIAVVLKADKDQVYDDTVELLDYGFTNFEITEVTAPQTFSNKEDSKYLLKEPVKYIRKKNESVRLEVNHDGFLVIQGEDGRFIKNIKLKESKPKEQSKTEPIQEKPSVQKNSSSNFKLLLLLIPFILIIIAFLFRKKIKGIKNTISRFD